MLLNEIESNGHRIFALVLVLLNFCALLISELKGHSGNTGRSRLSLERKLTPKMNSPLFSQYLSTSLLGPGLNVNTMSKVLSKMSLKRYNTINNALFFNVLIWTIWSYGLFLCESQILQFWCTGESFYRRKMITKDVAKFILTKMIHPFNLHNAVDMFVGVAGCKVSKA